MEGTNTGSFLEAQATLQAAPPWVEEIRSRALEAFLATGIPSRRHEEWKYTSLRDIAETRYALATGEGECHEDRLTVLGDGTETVRLVFVDGRLATGLSRLSRLPEGLTISTLDKAMSEQAEVCRALLAPERLEDGNPFSALNRAFLGDGGAGGVLITVAPGRMIETAIDLVFVDGACDQDSVWFPRLLIDLGKGASLTVHETYLGAEGQSAKTLVNAITEIRLAEGARLAHGRVQLAGPATEHIGVVRTQVAKDASYESFVLATGGKLLRNDLNAALAGPGAEARLSGLYVVSGTSHIDNHTVIDHRVADASSHQLYKGVLSESGRGVFNGKVFVRPGAQRTVARQLNRNLLLSKTAEIDTKPELQIDADDVTCSHGASVGRPDEGEIFYLRSRGIPAGEALAMLSRAFAEEAIFAIRDARLKERIATVWARSQT